MSRAIEHKTFSEMIGGEPASFIRKIVREETERMLDRMLGANGEAPRGGFPVFLKSQSESSLWNSEGDDQHDGAFYRVGAASCFFPVAARELVADGMKPALVAAFCIEGALEALAGLPLKERKDKLLEIVLAYTKGSSPHS
jgi:hypothetical protein